jgi:sugar lactone lactonase YvrE
LGSDGIALSADGEHLYFGPVGGRTLYSIPTERLRDRRQASELLALGAVNNRGERGVSDGFETDTNGFIYAGNMEQNEIGFHNPANASMSLFVRDPRISWVDTSKSFFCCAIDTRTGADVLQCLLEAMAIFTLPITSLLSVRPFILV